MVMGTWPPRRNDWVDSNLGKCQPTRSRPSHNLIHSPFFSLTGWVDGSRFRENRVRRRSYCCVMHDALSTNLERYRSTTTTSGFISRARASVLPSFGFCFLLFNVGPGLKALERPMRRVRAAPVTCGWRWELGPRGATTGLILLCESVNQQDPDSAQPDPLPPPFFFLFLTGWGVRSRFRKNQAND